MTKTPSSAAVYVRISLDPDDEQKGVTRQREDCEKLAKARGWTVGKVYEDNSVSAYKRTTVRPGWTDLLRDLKSGKRDALIVYDLDRVARQPRDLEDLLDQVEQHNLPTAVVTGDLKLDTPDGRFMARLLVNVAYKASADTGRRVSRAAQQRAEQGKPQKAKLRPFGYTADYKVIEDEAAMIREAYKRVIAGEGLTSITKDFAANFETVSGGRWSRGTVKKILTRAANAGIRLYKGEEIATGNWVPIVDRQTYDAAMAVMKTRSDAHPVPDFANVHLLSTIAQCGKCGTPMYGRRKSGTNSDQYACMPTHGGCGGIARSKAKLDEYVIKLVARHIAEASPTPVPVEDHSDEIAGIEQRITELQQAYSDGSIELADFSPMVKVERDKLKALQQKRAKVTATQINETFADKFEQGNLSQQRVTIKRYISAVVVNPTRPGARKFDYDAIKILWK